MIRFGKQYVVPRDSVNIAYIKTDPSTEEEVLSIVAEHESFTENINTTNLRPFLYTLASTELRSRMVLFSNRSRRDPLLTRPVILFYKYELGTNRLDSRDWVLVDRDSTGKSDSIARQNILGRIRLEDQSGNRLDDVGWDFEISASRTAITVDGTAQDGFILDIYTDRQPTAGVTWNIVYEAYNTVTSVWDRSHKEALNPEPYLTGPTDIVYSQNPTTLRWTASSTVVPPRAPAFALFCDAGVTPTPLLFGSSITFDTLSVSKPATVADVMNMVNSSGGDTIFIPMSPLEATLDIENGSYSATQYGTVVRYQNHFHARYQDYTQISLESPRGLPSRYSWYPRIRTGSFTRFVGGIRYEYGVPEWDDQFSSPSARYGHPVREVAGERPRVLGPRSVKVAYAPIYSKASVSVYAEGTDISSNIRDIDRLNGIIYFTERIDEGAFEVDYAYVANFYEYRGVDLNPSLGHNTSLANKFIGIYLVPWRTVVPAPPGSMTIDVTQTVFHVIADNIADIEDALSGMTWNMTTTPYYNVPAGALLLAVVQPSESAQVTSVKITDTRSRGGGLAVDTKTNIIRESEDYWDMGDFDGRQAQGAGVIVASFPDSIIGDGTPPLDHGYPIPTGVWTPTGLLGVDKIQDLFNKYKPAGTYVIQDPE